MSQIPFRRLCLLAFVAVSVLFVELGGARLWDRDEPRNARASHEMLARGDWVVPTFNGQLRDHKPILLYWGQMLSYSAFGESEFTARLPSALAALLAIVAVALVASRLSGHPRGISHEGFWAAGALATCLLFTMAGRAATPDACLVAFSTLGIAALVLSAVAAAPPYSSGRVRAARWLPAMFGYAMLGLAGLAKGPVGIILPLAVVHAWWMICSRLQQPTASNQRNLRLGARGTRVSTPATLMVETYCVKPAIVLWRLFNPLQCARAVWALKVLPGICVSLLVAVPWYYFVGVATDGAFLRGFFLEHNFGRAMHSMEGHQGSVFFYPVALLVGTFPWSLWLIPIVLWCRHASRESTLHRQMVVLAGVWIAVYVVAFSLARTKLPSYITPCYAGAALAIGGYLRQFEIGWSMPPRTMRLVASTLTVLVGMALSGTLIVLSAHESMPLLMRAAFAGVVVSAVGMLGFFWEYVRRPNRLPLTWLVGAAAFQVILFGYGAKSVDGYRQDLRMLAEVKEVIPQGSWLSIGGMEPSWVHYLDSEIVEVTESHSNPESWQQVADFLSKHPDGKLIVVGDAIEELNSIEPMHALADGLIEVAKAPRFLRAGEVAVYAWCPQTTRVAEHAENPLR